MSPPTDASAVAPVHDETAAPSMASRMGQRRSDASRYGGSSSQASIDLDSLILDAAQSSNSKLTPLPEGRLDQSQFRSVDGGIPYAQPMAGNGGGNEVEALRQQNAELSRIMEEMKPLLEEASAQEQRIQFRDQEVQSQLNERDQQVTDLNEQIQKLEEQILNAPAPRQPKTRDELEEWADELEKESSQLTQHRRLLDEERKQLHDDEESLEKQMREMECSMARERAMMARQETELKRLSAEIQHELELLQRGDSTLREQLSKFQRRHQEVLARSVGGGPSPLAAEAASALPRKEATSMISRIFRGGK